MPVVPAPNYNVYLNHEELCEYLQSMAEAVPHLVRVYSIGQSAEGRSLMVAEVTNLGTGPASQKPAMWVDGNSHGGEVAGSSACLALLYRLASDHGRDETVTELLDTQAFYIMPRMAPDGAELGLTSGLVSSAGRRLSFFEGLSEGLVPGDVNGDSRILQMRIEDPCGEWKVSRRDPRLMLRRDPDDKQGPFYRLYREGFFDAGAGETVRMRTPEAKCDLTDDFISGASRLSGPFSLAESRAVSEFLHRTPNICFALSFRTEGSGVVLSGLSAKPEQDKALLRLMADRAADILQAPVAEENENKDFTEWLYREFGILSLRVNAWSLPRLLGFERGSRMLEEAELLAVLRWIDRECSGRGFESWKPFEHPQLGFVEIGGWDVMETWLNPPPGDLLAELCRVHTELALSMASSLPGLRFGKSSDEIVGWSEDSDSEDPEKLLPLRRIRCEIYNKGFLPVWLTQAGRSKDYPVIADIKLNEGCTLIMGQRRRELEPLAGIVTPHLDNDAGPVWFGGCSEEQRRVAEWLVRGDGEISVKIIHPRAGVREIIIDGEDVREASGAQYAPNVYAEARPPAVPSYTAPASYAPPAPAAPFAAHKQVQAPSAAFSSAAAPKPSAPVSKPSVPPAPASSAAENVRPVSLTGVFAEKEAAQPSSQPASPRNAMSGFRPSVRGARPSAEQPARAGESPKEAVPVSLIREEPRHESALRKESQPAGRIFGSALTKPKAPLGRTPGSSAGAANPQIEASPAIDQRNVKPHSLIASRSPQETAPEAHPPADDAGLENPLSPSKSAPLLLRRQRDE
ncbi:MAG: hypothetical protein K6G50_00175 [bacterium]|nr:hypothetical protein [bacterium]